MPKHFIECFNDIVALYPESPAIIQDGGETLSYRELASRAEVLCADLEAHGLKAENLAALELPKSIDYLVALLAVWQAGGAWTPIEPSLPEARKEYMRSCSRPYLRITKNGIVVAEGERPYPDRLSYVIFTSGSSGRPKGVMVPHDGLTNVIEQQIDMFHINPESRVLWLVSSQFDASVSDIGVALLSGACLVLPELEENITPDMIIRLIAKHDITYLDLPPSLLPLLPVELVPETLETIVIGGEGCSVEAVRKWSKKVRLINVYGPTEATICTSMRLCDEHWNTANIGVPISGINYSANPSASEGELLISGKGLALGYIDQPELTAEKFISDQGKRVYRTGDWVRQEPDGSYVFLGRIDRQIKLAGKLIAPEEIEAALVTHPGVGRAAVILEQEKLIVAIESKGTRSSRALRNWLKERLPIWMLPHQFVFIDQLPKLASGKVNYDALAEYLARQGLSDPISSDSDDPVEYQLQMVWKKVLNLHSLPDVTADFYDDLGGDSLKALEVILAAEECNLLLPSGAVAEHRTIAFITQWLRTQDEESSVEALSADQLRRSVANAPEADTALLLKQKGAIFITGATGFLGCHLLAELMRMTEKKIICLVREDDVNHVGMRLIEAAEQYVITIDYDRIECLCGDVSQPKLGLDEKIWERLATEVSDIYHCAAEIHALKPFTELYSANVGGVLNILELASTHYRKQVHYASTLSVFVGAFPLPKACLETDRLQQTKCVYGGYAQSKWTAETVCWDHDSDSTTLYRFGLLTGHSQSGHHAPKDYLKLFIDGLISLGCLPEGQWDNIRMDMTPIDYAAKAMATISLNPKHRCYHIAGTKTVSFNEVVEALERAGIQLKKVPLCKWQQSVASLNGKAAASLMALGRLFEHHKHFNRYRSMDLFQATGTQFDQSNTLQALEGSGIVCPEADGSLLDNYMKWFLNV